MTPEENKAILLRFLKELGKGNIATVDQVCAENFVFHSPTHPGFGKRLIDAVIIADGDHRIASPGERVSPDGHDLIVVQTKAYRLGMYLMGQALFSRVLIEDRFNPRSIRTVALCSIDDAVLRPIAERYGIEVVDDPAARSINE